MAAIKAWYDLIDQGTVSGGTVGGTADAITLTNSPTVSALAHGQRYLFRAGSANTGAVTLNVDGLGATALRYRDTALSANDIAAGDLVMCVYDSNTTRFQLLTPPRVTQINVPATQAQMEAASSTSVSVTPGRQHFHPGHPKAYLKWNTATSTSILGDYGVASLTDNGTGDTTITFDTAFADTNYAISGFAKADGAETDGGTVRMADAAYWATTTARVNTQGNTNTKYDTDGASVIFCGDHA